MVKNIVLDNVRFLCWGGVCLVFCFVLFFSKRKNQRILLIHVLSHEAIISNARHASYVIITSSVLLYLLHEQFSYGGETGYSQDNLSLKIMKIFWFPDAPWARLIIPVCCFIHSHFPLSITTSLLITVLGFDLGLGNRRLTTCCFSICSTDCSGESSICDFLIALANKSWRP